jgi:predicted neutral ceramidase superfamily lipid hydrolase
MGKLKNIYNWFESQNTFGKYCLVFAASQILVFVIMALKEYKIFDATPYMISSLPIVLALSTILIIVGAAVIIIVMFAIIFKSNQNEIPPN